MTQILITNARIFDGINADCASGMNVLIEDDLICEVSDCAIDAKDAQVIDIGGKTLMPGLIDAHIHAYASDVNVQNIEVNGKTYQTAHASKMLGHALNCGFTTVRDVGGGDWDLWNAIEDGLIRAPRFFYVGHMLSMTGGHGDWRKQSENIYEHDCCACSYTNMGSVIVDGVDECIKAAREELRRGAHCLKIKASGGVASPTDPIWANQFREDEIRAIVNETNERRTYVSAHCHPVSAIRRCVEFGVRCIEHGTLMDDETAQFVAEKGAYVVPTMAILYALTEYGKRLGFPPESQQKVDEIQKNALVGLDAMRKANVKVGFGTDLLGETYMHQCKEFELRSDVFTPIEILRQTTSVNAEILMQKDKLGCVKPGAYADLIVVDGDPLQDIGLLSDDGQNLSLIMRGGELVRNGF